MQECEEQRGAGHHSPQRSVASEFGPGKGVLHVIQHSDSSDAEECDLRLLPVQISAENAKPDQGQAQNEDQ